MTKKLFFLIIIIIVFSLPVFPSNSKPAIAISEIKAIGIESTASELVIENLITYIVDTQKYDVVERSHLEKVLKELRLSGSDLTNQGNAVKAGKLMSAHGIIVGSIIKLGRKITISARLVSTETGRTIRSATREILNIDDLADACKYISYKLVNIEMTEERAVSGGYGNLVGAVISGNLPRVKELLKSGTPINASNNTGVTPIMHAAYYGKSEIIEFLISNNAIIEAKDVYGQTALLHAAHRGRFEAVKALLKNKASVNVIAEKNNNQTALMYATFFGYEDIVKLLIKYNADVNMRNSLGNTALSYAINKGHLRIADIIRNAGGTE